MSVAASSPPRSSVMRCTTCANSTCMRAREVELVVGLEHVGDAALARLRVDADDRLVGAAHVGRVDRQVRHVPDGLARALVRLHALLDRVLVRAREGRVDELAGVRMARVDRQLGAHDGDVAHLVDVRQVEPGIDALREQVERQRDQVDVAGALAVAEQRALDALAAGHQRELGRRHGRAAVVVRVQADDDALAPRDPAAERLDHVGVEVRGRQLDGRRQVEHQPALGRRLEDVHDGLAHLEREVRLGGGEALGRVLEADVAARCRRRPARGCASRRARPCRGCPRGRAGRRRAAGSSRSSCRGARRSAGCPRGSRTCARSGGRAPA